MKQFYFLLILISFSSCITGDYYYRAEPTTTSQVNKEDLWGDSLIDDSIFQSFVEEIKEKYGDSLYECPDDTLFCLYTKRPGGFNCSTNYRFYVVAIFPPKKYKEWVFGKGMIGCRHPATYEKYNKYNLFTQSEMKEYDKTHW